MEKITDREQGDEIWRTDRRSRTRKRRLGEEEMREQIPVYSLFFGFYCTERQQL